MRCYLLGLGSNISPDINIPSACRALDMLGDVLQVSPAIATTTVGDTFTGPFMNQLVILQTELTEITLKENLHFMSMETFTPMRFREQKSVFIRPGT